VGANLDLVHCTVTENEGDYGRASRVESGGQLNLINSIVWNNGGAGSDEISIQYDETVNVTTSIVSGGEFGGIDEDPLLDSNAHLTSESPAIDRSGVVMADASALDALGGIRPRNAIPDLGWCEYNDTDTDSDGLPDWWEMLYFLNLDSSALDDNDSDGINNYEEFLAGSDPANHDTNLDGIEDNLSWGLGLDPANLDIDGDGISNGVEVTNGTDPFKADTDGDGYDDGVDAFPLDNTKWLAESGDSGDHTAPTITLIEPTIAVPL